MPVYSLSEVDFSPLYESLVSATLTSPSDVPPDELAFTIESYVEDLRKALIIPPKSDESRQKIKTGGLGNLAAFWE